MWVQRKICAIMMYPSLFWSISNVKSNINHLYETTD